MYEYDLGFISYSGNIHAVIWLLLVALLFADAVTRYRFAKAAGYDSAGLAFIPIGSMVLTLQMARWSGWLVVFLFVPFIGGIIFTCIYIFALHESYANHSEGSAGAKVLLCLAGLGFIANLKALETVKQSPQQMSGTGAQLRKSKRTREQAKWDRMQR